MRRRDGAPLWIDDNRPPGEVLQRADLAKSPYDEAWLQNLLQCHPDVFPIEQIEPGFGKLIPLCRELPVLFGGGRSGALDNLLATRDGGLVLVEAKLWRNPEARRSAVAQALEYAAAVFRMSYSELEKAVLKARALGNKTEASLFEIVAADSSGVDSEEFVDAVSRNLARGRAVIAVVGDGIREDIVPIANLVQSHAGHRFTFALVELAVYKTPAPGIRLLVPSVLAQTTLIERGVVRIEGGGQTSVRVTVEPALLPSDDAPPVKGIGLGEDEFFELLEKKDPRFPGLLKSFLTKAQALGVYVDLQGSLNLKHASSTGRPLNMGYIERSGIVATDPSTWWDRRTLGRRYNEKLAGLTGGSVIEAKNGDTGLRTAAGKMPRLSDLLPQHEQAWLNAMEQYIRDGSAVALQDEAPPMSSPAESGTVREIVLEVGGEGGSITLVREREAGKSWRFGIGTNELAIYDMLSEEDLVGLGPPIRKSGSVASFREALALLDTYRWFKQMPLEVHPEYLDAIVRAVAERGGPRDGARWLLKFARSVAVLTGAGVSAESGIPTFRSDGGYWRTHRFQDLATPEGFSRDPKLVWTWYEERRRAIALARPNDGHYAICEIERTKPIFTLITQNVDGLHQLAGSRNPIELHGDIWTVRCLKCGEEHIDRSELDDLPPHCHCGGMLRPGVVWFGEGLPTGAIEAAEKAVRASDVLIVAGTSGLVYPAAGLISMANAVIEINPEATDFSDHVTFSLRGTSAETLPLLLRDY